MIRQSVKKALQSTGLRREHVAATRMLVERTLISAAPRRGEIRSKGRILCYHSIGQPMTGVNDVKPDQFARHLDLAKELGYRFVPARQIAETGGQPKDLAITFDDAWTSTAENAAPIVRKRDIPWSLFVVSSWSEHEDDWSRNAILNWNDLKALSGSDLELGSHSVSHPDFGQLDDAETRRQLFASRDLFEARLGFAPSAFAIPLGQSMNWTSQAHELAKDAGYECIYAQAEETRFPGTIARSFVTKFDNDTIFRAILTGKFDRWEEWT